MALRTSKGRLWSTRFPVQARAHEEVLLVLLGRLVLVQRVVPFMSQCPGPNRKARPHPRAGRCLPPITDGLTPTEGASQFLHQTLSRFLCPMRALGSRSLFGTVSTRHHVMARPSKQCGAHACRLGSRRTIRPLKQTHNARSRLPVSDSRRSRARHPFQANQNR